MSERTDQPTLPRLRLTLSQLEVFAATARAGTTRGAAERVARSQSAASTSLAALEQALGSRVFDRVGRRLVLNDAGQALLPKALALLEQAGELHRPAAAGRAPVLRLAASFTIGEHLLPDLVVRWKTANPDGRVQLTISNTRDVLEAVARFDADLGFVEGRQRHDDLLARRWIDDELVIVASPGHALADRTAGVRDLRAATWVLREPGSGTREATDAWLAERLGHLQPSLELGSSEAVKRVVAAGVGLGCLSRLAVAEALAQGWLVEVKTRLRPLWRVLATVVHRQRPPGAAAEAFLAECRAMPARKLRP